jgi:hypothetical protein
VPPPTITPLLVAELLAEGERMPLSVHVIDHPDARVLVDTGITELHPAVADLDPRLFPLSRATRRDRKPPSDAEIERGLRERAVSDPPAAEILLRWLQKPRIDERVHGVDLDAMSEAQLESLYAGLVRVVALPADELRALVRSLLAEKGNPGQGEVR